MTKVIARELGISYRTVNWHMRKLCSAYSASNSIHFMYLAHPLRNRELPDHPLLTRHENSILHMIMRGADMREIAKEKEITYATARIHREHIRDKTGTKSIRETAAILLRMGLDEDS